MSITIDDLTPGTVLFFPDPDYPWHLITDTTEEKIDEWLKSTEHSAIGNECSKSNVPLLVLSFKSHRGNWVCKCLYEEKIVWLHSAKYFRDKVPLVERLEKVIV